MAVLDSVDWSKTRRHYDDRVKVHETLVRLLRGNRVTEFAELALGISNGDANYSAVEHGLGPKILATNINAARQIFDLAERFLALTSARIVPEMIRGASMRYLQIGVGSEISCMVNPQVCWVANARTIWAHLVIKHADNFARANEELKLYREADLSSEMAYQMWSAIHAELNVALTRVAELGRECAVKSNVRPGEITFLWADAIASELYDAHQRKC